VTTSNLPDQKLQFEIKDTGIGFEPVTKGKLFQAFEQSGRGITRQFGGLGLGLAISRSIIEAHGGSIRAHSEGAGTGATFTVILPLRSTSAKPAPSRPSAGSTPVGRGRDILIVEDHADTRETLQRLLERGGHCVTAAGSGREALGSCQALEVRPRYQRPRPAGYEWQRIDDAIAETFSPAGNCH
jgi:hypothetical protein